MTKAVNIAWRSHRAYSDVQAWVNGSLVDTLRRAGYHVESMVETDTAAGKGTEWTLKKNDRSLILFPISILAWLINKSTYHAVLKLNNLSDGRTELLVAGDLPGSVAKLLQQLANSSVAA